jgi:hypothetical protein
MKICSRAIVLSSIFSDWEHLKSICWIWQDASCDNGLTLFAWLISHQPAVLFSHNKPTTSQPHRPAWMRGVKCADRGDTVFDPSPSISGARCASNYLLPRDTSRLNHILISFFYSWWSSLALDPPVRLKHILVKQGRRVSSAQVILHLSKHSQQNSFTNKSYSCG